MISGLAPIADMNESCRQVAFGGMLPARACARYGVLVVGEEMKGSRTRLRKVLPEREREEAAVPEAIERLISRGPPAVRRFVLGWRMLGLERSRLGAVGIAMASLPVRPRSFGVPVPTTAAGWALIAASCARSAWMFGATVTDRHLPFQSSRSRQCYRLVGEGGAA
jgi:hypothetical protein